MTRVTWLAFIGAMLIVLEGVGWLVYFRFEPRMPSLPPAADIARCLCESVGTCGPECGNADRRHFFSECF